MTLTMQRPIPKKNESNRRLGGVFLLICLLIILSFAITLAAELPSPIKKHYRGCHSIYWKIKQVTISPIFDKPETVLVEFYIDRPNKIYVIMPQKQIYSDGETVWTYLAEYKQVQKDVGERIFNPFDFIDSSQTNYEVKTGGKSEMIMQAIDKTLEPDNVNIRYKIDGRLETASYLDLNGNTVKLDFLKEAFGKGIPKKLFLNHLPKDVKIIDFDKE